MGAIHLLFFYDLTRIWLVFIVWMANVGARTQNRVSTIDFDDFASIEWMAANTFNNIPKFIIIIYYFENWYISMFLIQLNST